MQRFKNVLVVATRDADAGLVLGRATKLAASTHARLTIFDVLDPLPRDSKKLFKMVSPAALEEMLTSNRLEELDKLAAPVRDQGIDVGTRVVIGTPFAEIIREILRNGHDLVMKSALVDGGARSPRFGSTDMHLMRECPCAVWMIKPARSRKRACVLAAVDPDPSDEEKNRLSVSIMELATSLSRLEESDLHVVHAWVLYSEELLHVLVGNVDKLLRDTRKTHRRWLNALLDRFEVAHDRRRVHLVKGKPKEVIPGLAMKKRVELVVIGTAARSGLPQFLIGNTAEDVLNQVDCSVLTVKPERFVSPVTLPERG